MGSPSDSETMNNCVDILEQEGIPFDYIVASAHRDPEKVKQWVEEAEQRGNKIIIAQIKIDPVTFSFFFLLIFNVSTPPTT